MKVNLIVNCCMCSNNVKSVSDLPGIWRIGSGSIYVEDGFCPEHRRVEDFTKSQCPGCVGGWMDCPLWEAFAYPEKRNITEDDHAKLCEGVCPRRVNGTFEFDEKASMMKAIDLSEKDVKAGQELSRAIREYVEKYPS